MEPASSVPEAVTASVAPGQDLPVNGLRGLDLTFSQLSDEGYSVGEALDGNQLYTFDRFGDQVEFVMPGQTVSGDSRPLSLRTALENVFPELDGAAAEEAEEIYAPYFSVSSSGGGIQAVYETANYIYTIYPDASGTLRGTDTVEIKTKHMPEPTATPEPTPTPEPTATPEPADEGSDSNYYILPQSSQRLLTYVDIQNFTKQDMMLARNEIFARHGRIFNDEDVRTYFEAQSWYNGAIAPEDFSTSVLSEIELQNIDFLKQHEDNLSGVSQQVGDSGSVTTYNEYMIPQSSSRRLTYSDIAGLSKWQLSIARNEIYARHGRMFNDADIRTYFEAQSWYSGTIAPEDFDPSVLSSTEQYNIDFIQSYE